jgi:predicted PurR-regulated permease PerM
MIAKELKLPFFVKAILFLVGLYVLFVMLDVGGSIIVPLLFATILATLLQPIVKFLVRLRINRVLAILLTLLLTLVLLVSLCSLLISQGIRLSESWPLLVEKFTNLLNQISVWASEYFDINPQTITDWFAKTKAESINVISHSIGQTLVIVGNGIVIVFLIPLYIFLILFYEPLLLDFIRRLSNKNNQGQVWEIVAKTKTVIQRYLLGLLIEAFIVAALEIAVLFIFGIEYALILGVIGALLNVIPYIGGVVAVALPMVVALVTKESGWYAVYVFIAYYIIQLIDNNYIVPRIVASRVKINALFSIIVVLAGNALWGIPGMFLSIPMLAIVKLIFDHIEPLKPWGFLLGDTMPSILKIKPLLFRKPKGKSI